MVIMQAFLHLLLLATLPRLILATSTTERNEQTFPNSHAHKDSRSKGKGSDIWWDWEQSELESAFESNCRTLVGFSSRTFEPVQIFHQTMQKLAHDQKVKTKLHLIDCDVKKELCRLYDVNEYPAIRLFKAGRCADNGIVMRRYRGRKTMHGIRSFLRKHEHAFISEVGSEEELSEFKTLDDVVIVAFLSGNWDEATEAFYTISEKHHENFIFGYTSDEQSAKKEGVSVPSIVCYKNTDGDHEVFTGPFTEASIEEFLATAPGLVIGEFSERNMETYLAPDKLSAYLFATTEDEARSLRHVLTPMAKKLKQYVTFGVADAIEYGPMAKNFGLVENAFPALVVHAPMNDDVFTYMQGRKIVASTVEEMLMTILQGRATSGQVFGENAPDAEEREPREVESGTVQHDEL